MYSGHIKCLACGDNGRIEIRGVTDTTPEFKIFRHLGHNAFTGYMRFLCPYCTTLLKVDPIEVLGTEIIRGFPEEENSPRIVILR